MRLSARHHQGRFQTGDQAAVELVVTSAPDREGFRCEEERTFMLGVDLGQSQDPTASAVVHYRKLFNHHASGSRTLVGSRFDCVHLERLPLGLAYPQVCQEVRMLMARKPIAGNVELVIDETGVGRAVGDFFDTAGLRPTRVTITAGLEQSWAHGGWHVPKQVLISTLDARLHSGELGFAPELHEAGAMEGELADFRRKVSSAGRYTFEARVGKHDDLVLAVAIALWCCVGRPVMPAPQFGTWGSTSSSPHLGQINGGDGAQWGNLGRPPG
jgi:hypothetical protein